MKIIIHTQYKENYGDEQNPHWKFKGGSVYVVEGINPNDHMLAKVIMDTEIKQLIEDRNPMSEEYIIDWSFADDNETQWDDWETPFIIRKVGDKYVASRYVKADDHWKDGYEGKRESYTMLPKGDRADYLCDYIKTPSTSTLNIRDLI